MESPAEVSPDVGVAPPVQLPAADVVVDEAVASAVLPPVEGPQAAEEETLAKKQGAPGAGSRSGETSAILKLKGLPYSITEEHVRTFFADFQVLNIRFVYEPDGRPSGLAFAEFESKDEAVKALAKNGEYIGERYVRLLHVPVTEMEEQVRLGTLAIPGNAAKLRSRLMRQQQHNRLAYLTGPLQLVPTGLQPNVAQRPPLPGLGQFQGGIAAQMQQQMPLDARLWSNYGQAQAPQGAHALAAQLQNLSVGAGQHQILNQGMLSAGHLQQVPLGLQQAPQQQHQQHQQQLLHAAAAPPPRPMQPLNPASATVKVRGLPYRSSPAEILSFFQGYNYLPDSLQIGLDSLGRPSGEAWLSFVNPPEALRAVRDLNRRYLGTRYLELSLC